MKCWNGYNAQDDLRLGVHAALQYAEPLTTRYRTEANASASDEASDKMKKIPKKAIEVSSS